MKRLFETGLILFAVMGFWGMIYPDLCFTQDVCKVIYENGQNGEAIGEVTEEPEEKDIFTKLCEAEPEQIRIESRFLDFLERKGKENVGDNR